MTIELSNFAARLRELISLPHLAFRTLQFDELALELFALQFRHNSAYRKICQGRGVAPEVAEHWTQIPAVPTSAFKELELSCIPPNERTAVFHSSGTTGQKPSCHFHCVESLAVYEASLWSWFERNCGLRTADCGLVILTPPPEQAPNSSLVHMFETIRQELGGASVPASRAEFIGKISSAGSWILDFDTALKAFQSTINHQLSTLIFGTAFSFVHLLDCLTDQNVQFKLPAGSRVMETGGYKNRSRSMPKAELHTLIAAQLGIPAENIICEYGMSELSSQAYDSEVRGQKPEVRKFQFPPWARAQIISPETGCEVADGEAGLIRIFDLANVFSVAAIQTEDLGVRRGDGFELIGRAHLAEARGCSLMTA